MNYGLLQLTRSILCLCGDFVSFTVFDHGNDQRTVQDEHSGEPIHRERMPEPSLPVQFGPGYANEEEVRSDQTRSSNNGN